MPESRVWFFEVLPQRPPPYPGECLSGYLLRLAEANGALRFWSLARDLFPRWTMDEQVLLLRWEYPLDAWGRLPLRAQLRAPRRSGSGLARPHGALRAHARAPRSTGAGLFLQTFKGDEPGELEGFCPALLWFYE